MCTHPHPIHPPTMHTQPVHSYSHTVTHSYIYTTLHSHNHVICAQPSGCFSTSQLWNVPTCNKINMNTHIVHVGCAFLMLAVVVISRARVNIVAWNERRSIQDDSNNRKRAEGVRKDSHSPHVRAGETYLCVCACACVWNRRMTMPTNACVSLYQIYLEAGY